MSDNEQNTGQAKNIVLNIVYSVLVLCALVGIGTGIVSVITPDSSKTSDGARSIAIGISFLLTILFSMWFAKRSSRSSS
jgi:uncharacterized membrane protein